MSDYSVQQTFTSVRSLILVCAFESAPSLNSFCHELLKTCFFSSLSYIKYSTYVSNCYSLSCNALRFFSASARPELPTHGFLQLLHKLNIYNEPLCYFADMCLLGLPLHSKYFYPFSSKVQWCFSDISSLKKQQQKNNKYSLCCPT